MTKYRKFLVVCENFKAKISTCKKLKITTFYKGSEYSPFARSQVMEAFQLLSNGGVMFNKVKYKKDVNLFTVCRITLQ
jgi:hypothetical protein